MHEKSLHLGKVSFQVFTISEDSRCHVPLWRKNLGTEEKTLDKGGRLPIARLTADTTEEELRTALEPVSNYDPDDESTYACNLEPAAGQKSAAKEPAAADSRSQLSLVTSPAASFSPPRTPAGTSPVSPLNDSPPQIAAK